MSNIAVVARSPEAYRLLARYLTAERVKVHLGNPVSGAVVRHDVPKLSAFNFVSQESLQGGVTRSTALDAHGKSLSSALLGLTIEEDYSTEFPTIMDLRQIGGADVRGGELFEQGGDAALADECHHNIDTMRRTDLSHDLIAHARFTRCIGEQSGVQQRNHRRLCSIEAPIRLPINDTLQHIAGRDWTLGPEIGRRRQFTNEIYKSAGKIEADGRPFVFCNTVDRALDHPCQM